MHVLIAHHTHLPVTTYGGTERIMWWLGKHLAALGHEVTYLVNHPSECPFATVLTIDSILPINDQVPGNVDCVHFFFQPRQTITAPYLVTNQGNVPDSEKQLPLDPNTVFISRNHAERHHGECFVYNGLDLDSYGQPDLDQDRRHLHFLAKTSWRAKNINGAMYIARAAGWPLEVMGGSRFSSRLSLVNLLSRKAAFHGMTPDAPKIELLSRSRGLLFPVTWYEPFGIAMLESLYCGSPVFGSPYGALPEVVTKDVGYLSQSYSDLIRAIGESRFSPEVCQQHVIENFTARQMSLNYLKLYQKVMDGQPLNQVTPSARPTLKEARKLKMNP